VHSLQVIRNGDWKLIEEGASYYTWEAQPLQLYNIREDPSEKHDRSKERPEIVARLRERLALHRKSAREEEPPERIPSHPPAVYGEEENAKYGGWVREQPKDWVSRRRTPRRIDLGGRSSSRGGLGRGWAGVRCGLGCAVGLGAGRTFGCAGRT